ncbi:MAG: phosphoribosylanthranilate isomerase [bacterium]
MRTRIKICGVTDAETARAAAAAGADAIGLIFHPPSARHLQLAQAAAIARAAPAWVASVAVMVNPSADFVRAVLADVRPSCLQFHGEEDAAFCDAFGTPYIKALRVARDADLARLEARYPSARGILLDAHRADAPQQYGGGGTAFDWARARYGGELPLILAGGLHAENVAEALTQVRPYGVDVSTGVEADAPGGGKDAAKIERFCREVQRYDAPM